VAREEPAPSIAELRAFLKEQLPEYMVPAAMVTLPALPLTSNGKLDRRALPSPEPNRAAPPAAPRTPTEQTLAAIWADVLGLDRVGPDDSFFDLGGDSILGILIVARASQAGLRLSLKQLFQHETLADLASVAESTTATTAEQGLVTGPVPLTPIQRWFFAQELPDPHHFNQAFLLELRQPLDPTLLGYAIQHLLAHHDALRHRFVRDAGGWQQVGSDPVGPAPVTRIELSVAPSERAGAIEAEATRLQASLDLDEGPLVRAALFDLGADEPGRLLLVSHHLAVDIVSWQVLLDDLQTVYRQLSRGEPVQLPPKTTAFKQWAERLEAYAQSSALDVELDYWLSEARRDVRPLPVDHPGSSNTKADARTVSRSLSREETTALLQEIPEAYRTQIDDVLLTALVEAFGGWTGQRSLLVDVEGHGREDLFDDVDTSRTVGWFTTISPLLLDASGAAGPADALKQVKEQLRRVPQRGIGYGVLRYLSPDADRVRRLRVLPQAEVAFNYLGRFDRLLPENALFALASESPGPLHSVRGQRPYLLEIIGLVGDGQLHIEWTYAEQIHRRSTVEGLADRYMDALRSLIAQSRSAEVGGYTPSDFPDVDLDQDELAGLLAQVGADGFGE
jgi:non-ribosomal peptide synthase protein (TIGR01720 family)